MFYIVSTIRSSYQEVTLMKGWITIGLCIVGILAFIGLLVLINALCWNKGTYPSSFSSGNGGVGVYAALTSVSIFLIRILKSSVPGVLYQKILTDRYRNSIFHPFVRLLFGWKECWISVHWYYSWCEVQYKWLHLLHWYSGSDDTLLLIGAAKWSRSLFHQRELLRWQRDILHRKMVRYR